MERTIPKTILFQNELHNGDIHMSRSYVMDLMSILGENNYYYHHRNNPRILIDIEGLNTVSNPEELHQSPDLIISTWIGQFSFDSQGNWIGPFGGCNFVNYYNVMRGVYQSIGVLDRMKPIDFYYPRIDYSKFKIQGIDKYFSGQNRTHILVCNNHVNSGQAHGSMASLVHHLSSTFPDHVFVLSNRLPDEDDVCLENVIYASNIINDPSISFDMNEISYIAKNCIAIIGRSSGPYSFSVTQDTVRSKVFVCFCNSPDDSWYTNDNKNLIWSNQYDKMNDICEMVLRKIK